VTSSLLLKLLERIADRQAHSEAACRAFAWANYAGPRTRFRVSCFRVRAVFTAVDSQPLCSRSPDRLDQGKQGFLVCTQPLAACIAGHFIPLLSIASELQSRGHNVTFLAQIQKDNEDVPKRSVSEAGVAFRALGFTPLNKTELEDIVAQVCNFRDLKLPYIVKMQARMGLIWSCMMEGRTLTLIKCLSDFLNESSLRGHIVARSGNNDIDRSYSFMLSRDSKAVNPCSCFPPYLL
jgi:hypothetical protein